ncbi:MAG: spore coat U domain-containing protein [Gammaproteobacteria bacterium]|nr:spore coat U domain-containing protein [Gammaproteobacteria bacterium]MBU1444415.1 spore coat U domain-containing protein [Gammaproteobacteria bacterium]
MMRSLLSALRRSLAQATWRLGAIATLAALAAFAAAPAQALCLVCTGSVSATPHAFGTYDPLASGPRDSTSTVSVTITGVAGLLVPYSISLGGGVNGSIADRQMVNGTSRMHYNLYTGSTRTTVWGDGSVGTTVSGSVLLTALLLTATVSHTVYGRIGAGQTTLVPGGYDDTITVTVLF